MERRKKRKINVLALIIMILTFFLIIALFFSLILSLSRRDNEPPPPTPTPDPRYKHEYNWENIEADGRFWKYEDDNYTSELGIDVSFHNEEIDWQKVKDAGIDFAFIRVGYRGYQTGEIHEDLLYRQNMEKASQAGVKLGVYFFSQAKDTAEAVEEAQYVLYEIKDYFIAMPVVFDMEEVTADDRIAELTDEERTEIAAAFCRTIRDAGYIPAVYGSENWLSGKIRMQDLQDDFIFWLASYHEVSVSTDFPFVFEYWQYYNRTEIPGIDTETDINIHFIRKSE